ncbi:MAG: baseplate J/gp47 family protein [Chloroflexi bacterium]|nr:baseplate J/gp47 family protein [Chloroflexota bacterium]
MKIQIIQLEPHDDVRSTQDKINWGKTARILLVWPARGHVLNRQLDLILLKRYCAEKGSQLALVTRDANVRFHAGHLGIPFYSHMRKAEQSFWHAERSSNRTRPQTVKRLSPQRLRSGRIQPDLDKLHQDAHPKLPNWITNSTIRVIAFALGVSAILAIAAVLLPSADIQLQPESVDQSIIISVTASPKVEEVQLAGLIPAQWHTVIVEGRAKINSSGSIPIPNQFASGHVLFTNLSDRDILIPAGTAVSTRGKDPVRFATTEEVILAANAQDLTVSIQAILAGNNGNVSANDIIAVEGSLGLNMTVINPTGTHGGSNRVAPAPNQKNYDILYNTLYQTPLATAAEEFQSEFTTDILPLSTIPVLSETIEQIYTPSQPEPADQLNLLLRLAFQIPVTDRNDLIFLGQNALEANLPSGFISLLETFSFTNLNTPIWNPETEKAQWQIQSRWETQAQINSQRVIQLTMGLPIADAQARLSNNLPLNDPPTITMQPTWWPRLPFLPFRISVNSSKH